MRGLTLLLLLASASACGPPPPCCDPPPSLDCCVPPDINITATTQHVEIMCPDAVCGFVREELDPAPCGCTWSGDYILRWTDRRLQTCLYTDQDDKDQIIRGTVRWWTMGCMGHVDVILRIVLEEDFRDVFITNPEFEYTRQVGVHSSYVALARAGSYDEIPQAGKSDMFFEVVMDEPEVGVHMEITSCDIDILDSGEPDAFVLHVYENISYNVSYADPNGERATYRAFMDDIAYSPFQRVHCEYAMYNGTTTLDTFSHSKSYMLVNPYDSGVVVRL